MDYLLNHWQTIAIVIGVVIFLLCYRWVLALCGVILVPDDSIGVVARNLSLSAEPRPAGRTHHCAEWRSRLSGRHAGARSALRDVALAVPGRSGHILYRASRQGGMRGGL